MTGTFRDPSGSLFDLDGRILRSIRPADVPAFCSMIESDVVRGFVKSGRMVATRQLAPSEVPESLRGVAGEWFEHERLGFVSVPAEWSAAMLAHAALHTLDLNLELLRHGYVLKDATPSNILFEDSNPVLVDVPSIVPLQAGQTLWLARHQFESTFLLPLLAAIDLGYPIQNSLADPARGIAHEQLARMYGPRRWLGMDRIRQVAVAAALAGRGGEAGARAQQITTQAPQGSVDIEKARFVLTHSTNGLRKAIAKLGDRVQKRSSNWSAYAASRAHYADADLVAKRKFVADVLQSAQAGWVLDIGANTGEFSRMAAEHARVVGIDLDEVSVSAIHHQACNSRQPIQALVVDLSQPTPAAGWRNTERKSFLERATGRFDLALMLAVGHHLRVSAGIPLAQIIETGLQLGCGSLLFEFVPTDDPMFRAIARGRESLYDDNSVENCERLLSQHAQIQRKQSLPNGRTLFWARRSPAG